jgi:aminopeptidase N
MANAPSAAEDLERSAMLDVVSYDLDLDLTQGTQTFASRAEVKFRCRRAGATTFADLRAVQIRSATLNGEDLDLARGYREGRLELPRLADENVLVVEAEFAYASAAGGLHYVRDAGDGHAYAYSKSSAGGASRIYCCFDQPDLLAAFTVSVTAPAGWSCLANGALVARPPEGDPGRWRFAATARIPTWLSAFWAGPYEGLAAACERDTGDPLPVTIQAIPSAAARLEPGRILELLRQPLRYYERSLGVRYPYGKCDLVFVPALTDLAYSVPGLIVLQDQVLAEDQPAGAGLFLPMVIAHELAHAWIGGLVTMHRREEMWLDEALTTYLSRTALADIMPGATPWAAATSATLPDDYYARDAGAVRQLESLIGREAVLAGLGLLLRRHAHGTATRDDLVRCWSQASGRDLRDWAAETLNPTREGENEPA